MIYFYFYSNILLPYFEKVCKCVIS